MERSNMVDQEDQPSVPEARDEEASKTPEQDELKALQERYLRLAAEFDNFRKRTERDEAEHRRRAADSVLLSVLEVVDNLDRALSAPATTADPGAFRTGIVAIRAQLAALLEREGVRPIPSEGREFDPFDMEAVMRAPSKEVPAGHVLQELQCGYKGRGRVLRPCKVIVSVGPPTEAGRAADVDDAEGGSRTQPQSRSKSPSQSPSPTQSQSQPKE
jgi:molecular chaperone GrpE